MALKLETYQTLLVQNDRPIGANFNLRYGHSHFAIVIVLQFVLCDFSRWTDVGARAPRRRRFPLLLDRHRWRRNRDVLADLPAKTNQQRLILTLYKHSVET